MARGGFPQCLFNLRGHALVKVAGFDQKNLFLPPYQQVLADRDRQLDTYRHTASYADDLTALRDNIAEVNAKAQHTLDEMLLEDFRALKINYEQATWNDVRHQPGKARRRSLQLPDIQRLAPFHWAFAFSKVMTQNGGFDAIITNPPWDVVKPNGKEFFEQYSNVVTKKKMSIHDFQSEQKKLLKDPDLKDAWLDYLSQFPHQSLWFRNAGTFSHQISRAGGKKVGSDLNTYKLFTERCYRLLRDGGRCGIVIPSGIYTDLGAKGLREMLFERAEIDALFGMENRKGVFEDIHKSFKFVVLTFGRCGAACGAGVSPASDSEQEEKEAGQMPAPQSQEQRAGQMPAPQEIAGRSEPRLQSGSCLLKDSRAAEIVQNALLHFEGHRYHLHAWCVMPNHVHVVVSPLGKHRLADILHSWKSFTAHGINKALSREGELWERESFDHLIRRTDAVQGFVAYTENNPVKANLCVKPEDWPHSSCGVGFQPASTGFEDPRATPFAHGRTRGELPHLEKQGGTYFITFRLRDAVMPQEPKHEQEAVGTPAPQRANDGEAGGTPAPQDQSAHWGAGFQPASSEDQEDQKAGRMPAPQGTTSFPAAFMRHEVSELEDFPEQGSLPIDVGLVKRLSPDSLSVMEFKSEADVAIAEKMARFPLLGEAVEGRWQLRLTQEFNMTSDSDLFHTDCGAGVPPASDSAPETEKNRAGETPAPQRRRLPLYEGKMIWHFDHQYAEPRYWVDEAEGRKRLAGRKGDHGQVMDYQQYRLGFRDVASNTNERSAIGSIIPERHFAGNTLPTQMPHEQNAPDSADLLAVLAIFNSFIFDWLIRQKITSHLNMFYVYQMPVPRLTTGDAGFAGIVERAAKLICTTPEFDDLAAEVGLQPCGAGVPPASASFSSPSSTGQRAGGRPAAQQKEQEAGETPAPQSQGQRAGQRPAQYSVTDPAERAKLRAELDGMVAHLYGLTEPEFEHVLATFPLVEQRVKDDALAAYRGLIDDGEAAALNPELAEAEPGPGTAQLAGTPALPEEDQAVLDLIAAGESASVEFKATARWDVRKNEKAGYIEQIVVKTVAALLNTDGGTLLIGVEDDGTVRGLADDFATLGRRPDRDGFEQWLMQTLLKTFGKDAAGQLTLSFHAVGEGEGEGHPGVRDVCRVRAAASPRPRFVAEQGREVFYIRTGNATNDLQGKELLDYCVHRWPERETGPPAFALRSGEKTRSGRLFAPRK